MANSFVVISVNLAQKVYFQHFVLALVAGSHEFFFFSLFWRNSNCVVFYVKRKWMDKS